jgi:osmotically-inducible protein OsmY
MDDVQIERNVVDALALAPSVNSAVVSVAVINGVVILSGFVTAEAEKLIAENIVKRAEGVRAIVNQIQIRDTGSNNEVCAVYPESIAGNNMSQPLKA